MADLDLDAIDAAGAALTCCRSRCSICGRKSWCGGHAMGDSACTRPGAVECRAVATVRRLRTDLAAARAELSACCPSVPAEMIEDDSDPPPALVDLFRASTAESLALRARLASPPSLAPLRTRAEALLAVADRATPGPWRAEPAYNNGGIPTADFYIPGHNGGATVEMVADDAYAIVALHDDAPALIRDLLAALGDSLPTKET